ncbi:MAG: V-type ATP synthase subunit C [Halobacteriaceae archaeon]
MSAGVGATNYEYVTARVRHRRASLFGEDDYRKLLRMCPGEIARFMEESEYELEINELGARHDGVDLIEFALNRNLARHFEDLLRWSNGRLYEQVVRYLRKFDAWNLKTVLRGHFAGSSPASIREDLIRAGEFDDAFIDQLVEAGSVDAVVELASSADLFGPPLADALDEFSASGVLVPLENAIDRAYYENLLGDLPRAGSNDRAGLLYAEFLRAEVDFRNVRNALRLARSGADLDPLTYYIEGGELFSATELRSLVADGNTDALVARLSESKYGAELESALDDLADAESLIGFEHALESALLSYSEHLSYVFPLSVCPVLAYVLAKEREVENVRAIARGREAGLDEEALEAELVML